MFFGTPKTNFLYFKQQPCFFYLLNSFLLNATVQVSLSESVFMSIFHRLKNDSKSHQNVIGNVASIYLVTLAVDIQGFAFAKIRPMYA